MLIPFKDYPVRPQMEQGESLIGYVYRFYNNNGYKIPVDGFRFLYALVRARGDSVYPLLKRLQPILGNSVALDRIWWVQSRLIDHPYPYQGPGIRITLSQCHPSFCPACLDESRFYYELWEIAFVEECPIHSCYLVKRCPNCSRILNWRYLLTNWRCHCGTLITSMRGVLDRRITAKIERTTVAGCSIELPASFQERLCESIDLSPLLRYLTDKRVSI
ncbi:TniQ family protein [Candidatus Methylobacter oryzae]|uniref:TniQ domain-containing protein n=1 Tax=Candidatus Methylobacter oryzae TaxID=2497749 RepID=A0ABY3CCG8_9GAMM|nr:hypothetical protein EKO24_007010 [Candidatus Methylobacter oryzae]